MTTPEGLDPIKRMLLKLMLCDLKNSIKEDPQKAIEKIDVYIKGLNELEQSSTPPPGQMPEPESRR